jgi:hypothetical protein
MAGWLPARIRGGTAKETLMGKTESKGPEYRTLTKEDLEEIAGEALPERAAMSLVNANIAIPVNLALAANVLSDGAIAVADAAQQAEIDQGN